jgi:hypothetical protein
MLELQQFSVIDATSNRTDVMSKLLGNILFPEGAAVRYTQRDIAPVLYHEY